MKLRNQLKQKLGANGFVHVAMVAFVILTAGIIGTALTVAGHADPSTTGVQKLCNFKQTIAVKAAAVNYAVQNNNYAGQGECLTNQGSSANFTVSSSAADNPVNNSEGPSSYPMIFMGCHWGYCTTKNQLPIEAAKLGDSYSSWNTSQHATGMWDVAYDLWYNTTPTTSGQPNGAEIMIWLNTQNKPAAPASAPTVYVGGVAYRLTVIKRVESGITWPEIIYRRVTPTTAVSNLNLRLFTRDSEIRGYIQQSWYFISAEAGFEIWNGGVGLATNSFSFMPSTATIKGAVTSGITNKCLTDYHDLSASGTVVESRTCAGSASQSWTITNDGTIRINGKCMSVVGNATANGSAVDLASCSGLTGQKWSLSGSNLVNYASAKCLKVPGASTVNDTQLVIGICDGGKDQTWHVPA